jgi:hypothetical protein
MSLPHSDGNRKVASAKSVKRELKNGQNGPELQDSVPSAHALMIL